MKVRKDVIVTIILMSLLGKEYYNIKKAPFLRG